MRRFLPALLGFGLLSSCSSRDVARAPTAERATEVVAKLDALGAITRSGRSDRALLTTLPTHASAPVRLGSGSAWVEIAPAEVREVEGANVKDCLVFADAADDLDLVYVREAGRVEELRLARTKAAASRARWNLRLGPAMRAVQIVDGRIEIVDDAGKVAFASEPPFAVDANGTRRALSLSLHGSTVDATLDTEGLVTPIAVDPAWVPVGSPSVLNRWSAALVKLSTGKLLYAGGQDITSGTSYSTAQVFDPTTSTWSSTVNAMSKPRTEHTATATTTKKVLIVGGWSTSTDSTAELYDEATNSFTGTAVIPAMSVNGGTGTSSARRSHAAVALPSGDVLVIGGRADSGGEYDNMFLAKDLVFTALSGKLARPIQAMQAVLLPDGRVLVAGGSSTQGGFLRYVNVTATVTVSGSTATVVNQPNLPVARVYATTFIANAGPHKDKAMLLGGAILNGSAEDQVAPSAGGVIFDPTTNTWSPIPNLMTRKRQFASGGLLPSGKALLAGGVADAITSGSANDDAEILDLVTMTWKSAGKLADPRAGAPGVTLNDGGFFMVGGIAGATDGVLAFPKTPAERFTLQANGATCSADGQCTSGLCVDGVCCDRACDGQCEACDATGSVGTCKVISGAPHGARERCRAVAAGDDPVCAATCDGTSKSCAFAATTVTCGTTACATGVETHASTCDGSGKCKDVPKACGDYTCGATACKTSCTVKADCSNPAHFCEAGKCIPQQPNGAACARDEACATGFCVDGVCCESRCDGQCQACDVGGQAGKCVAIKGRPHGTRTDCTKDATDACKSLSCDGTNTAMCAGSVGPCGNYACDDVDKICKKTCANNGDCGSGFECDTSGKCVPRTSKCASSDTMQSADGTKTQCIAFVCRDGVCLDKCTSSNDCLNGFACDGSKCIATTSGGGGSEDSGGCAMTPRAQAPWWLAVLVLGLVSRGRRR